MSLRRIFLFVAVLIWAGTTFGQESQDLTTIDTFVPADSATSIALVLDTLNSTTVADVDVIQPELRVKPNQWWVFLFAIFILISIGILRNINSRRHQLSFMSFWIKPKVEAELLEDSYQIDFFQMFQIFISCLLFAWLISLFRPFDLNITIASEFKLLLLWILAVSFLYSLKYFLHYIVGLILQVDGLSKVMVYSQSNMMYAASLALFPCLLIYYYTPAESFKIAMQWTIVAVLIAVAIMRLVKSSRIYFALFPYRRVYIFIYLCTLEILPLLVLVYLIGDKVF